jgi:2,4-dienoyl-CoA reductase-like NADH-dependent reductase (Old Yellow Enzyme family)
VAGQSIMAAANELIVIFIGLEISSIASYVLAGYLRREKLANEAAAKYFLLGSFATAFLLYGIALVFGATGTTNLLGIREALASTRPGLLVATAASLMFVGFGFKVSVAPFQIWAPDVYQGAPSPVTAFLAAGPKAAAFAVFVRVFMTAFGSIANPLTTAQGAWTALAPSAIPFAVGYPTPAALDEDGVRKVVDDFVAATRRSREAGFQVIEVHAAHGYLLHEFLSPLSNHRDDRYGGSLENRARLLREVVEAVRDQWPEPRPLFVRVSATDWAEGGWNIDECVELARWMQQDGVDLIDCSSGGTVPHPNIPLAPGYQVPFAARIRRDVGIATGAVGLITDAHQAESILAQGDADLILMARESLRDPYFPRRAAAELGVRIEPPVQYQRSW